MARGSRPSLNDMSRWGELGTRDLRAGCLRKLGRGKGDDRHRADSDPGDGNASRPTPGHGTSRTRGPRSVDNRVHPAEARHGVANRRVLRHSGFPELGHRVLQVVLELPYEAATLQPPAAQRARHLSQELGSGVAANLPLPQARVQAQSRSRCSGAASSQPAREARSGSSATPHTRVCAGRRPSPNGCVPNLPSRAYAGRDTTFPREPQARHPSEPAAQTRWRSRAWGPAEESPARGRRAVPGSPAYLGILCIGLKGVKDRPWIDARPMAACANHSNQAMAGHRTVRHARHVPED